MTMAQVSTLSSDSMLRPHFGQGSGSTGRLRSAMLSGSWEQLLRPETENALKLGPGSMGPREVRDLSLSILLLFTLG